MKGISTNQYCTDRAQCIKQAGFDFIIRYYSKTTKQPEKVILPAEVKAISEAGLQLAVIYQDSANKPAFFTRARGEKNGRDAYAYAKVIGQPGGSAIYFAVDYDAEPSQIKTVIKDYFLGVKQGFESAGGGNPVYDIGVYGSGAACKWLRTNLPFVKYSWLALATGWRDSKTYADWDAKQFKAAEDLCGISFKLWQHNETRGNFGQFSLERA